MKTCISHSERETMNLAAELAKKIKSPAIICLYGDLGAGKTTFTKGFAAGLGMEKERIKSPTYTYLREEKNKKYHLFHFDFYRLEAPDDFFAQELHEIMGRKNVFILIEWPEKVESSLPVKRTNIVLKWKNENTRLIEITP
jgi:tRNA threonylcarbamoyladenosine biosynthesis protein TsaE